MAAIENPFHVGREEIARLRQQTKIIFVDFHAETTSEKIAFARMMDGQVSAVIGTHTHVQTAAGMTFWRAGLSNTPAMQKTSRVSRGRPGHARGFRTVFSPTQTTNARSTWETVRVGCTHVPSSEVRARLPSAAPGSLET
jgi:hypothetical protein